MPLTTPGHDWIDDETVTYEKLRLAASPVVTITEADKTDLAATLGAASAGINWLKNSDFRSWTAGTSIALPFASWKEQADSWEAYATYTDGVGAGTGASPAPTTYITYARIADTVHDHVLYAVALTGEPNGAKVRFGQRLSGQVAAAMLEGQATLTIELENRTGASQSPVVIFESCDSFENYSATTSRFTETLAALANNARQTYTVTLDLSADAATVRNGGRLYVKLDGVSATSKSWRVFYARLEPGTVATPRRIERDAVNAATSASAAATVNYLDNGDFSDWVRPSVTCTEDVDNYGPRSWVTIPQDGSNGALERIVDSPTTESLYCARFTGSAAVSSTCDFAQDIPRAVAATLRAPLVFTVSIYNGTGSSFVPDFRLDTCDAEDSTTRTNRLIQPLIPCSASAWTTLTVTLDGSTYTNFENGARMGIRTPTGVLNTTGKSVRFAQARLVKGTTAAAVVPEVTFVPGPLASTALTAVNLKVVCAAGIVTVTCDAAVCERADGTTRLVRNVNAICNLGTTGLGGLTVATATVDEWYLLYIVANGEGTASVIAHREDTGTPPLLFAGYQWVSGVIGTVHLLTGGVGRNFTQRANLVMHTPLAAWTGSVTTANTWQQATLAGVKIALPKVAVRCSGSLGTTSSAECRASLAADSSGTGQCVMIIPAANNLHNLFTGAAAPFTLPIATGQTVWVMADATAMPLRLETSGFEL
jgi:hypothetical protein